MPVILTLGLHFIEVTHSPVSLTECIMPNTVNTNESVYLLGNPDNPKNTFELIPSDFTKLGS